MSPIVSRRPSSRNHWNEDFWMAIRLGRSRTFSMREKEVRARGEATVVVKEEASLGGRAKSGGFRRAGELTSGTSAQPVSIPTQPPLPQANAAAGAGFARRTLAHAPRGVQRARGDVLRTPPGGRTRHR